MQFGSCNDDNENYQQCCDPKGAFGLALQVVAKVDRYRVGSGEHWVASDSSRPPIRGTLTNLATHRSDRRYYFENKSRNRRVASVSHRLVGTNRESLKLKGFL